VIFTSSSETEFSAYKPDNISYKDAKLSIYFETQEMMEETLILLKFNCPDANCDYIGNGWADLKLHARAVHSRLMWFVLLSILTGRLFSDSISGYSPVTCVLGTKRFSLMNMHSIQRTSSQSIYPLCTIDM